MNTIAALLMLNLETLLPAKPQADEKALAVSIPHGADVTQFLSKETYQLWRDKFVHEFWMDSAWIDRDHLMPVSALEQAHLAVLAKV